MHRDFERAALSPARTECARRRSLGEISQVTDFLCTGRPLLEEYTSHADTCLRARSLGQKTRVKD